MHKTTTLGLDLAKNVFQVHGCDGVGIVLLHKKLWRDQLFDFLVGEGIYWGKCASDPGAIAELVRKRAPTVKLVVFEIGPLSVWFYHTLRAEGLPACWRALDCSG